MGSLDEALGCGPSLAIAAPVPDERPDLICRLLEAGVPTWVDKPMAVTHAGLDQVMAAAARWATPLSVGLSYRGDPLVRAARAAVAGGRIGKLVRTMACGPHKMLAGIRPAWHWTKRNGGILIDIGSHHADIVCWFAEGKPVTVTGMHTNVSQPEREEFQDFGQAQVRFDDGSLGHYEVDWLNPDSIEHFGDTRFWFQGTAGKIELRLGDEVSARIWTGERVEDIEPVGEDAHAWERRLLEELCAGKQGDLSKGDAFGATRVTLEAYESAEDGSAAVAHRD
jgi:predicted dehydrogenase